MPTEAARVETTIDASPADVWRALTTPATLREFFFGADVISDWRPGSPIRFRGEWKGKPYEDKGEIQTFEPPKRLAYTHWSAMSGAEDRPENYHIVTFALAPAAKGAKVVLTQTNPDGAKPITDESRREFTKNWQMVLDGLKKVAER